MEKKYSVAIDGPSGAGKSSLARRCAEKLGFIYVDTGAMYRTMGLAAHRQGLDCKNEEAVSTLFPSVKIEMKYQGGEQRMLLNGEDVSSLIRTPEISACASDVSALPRVRQFLEDMQKDMAKKYSVIMDGRDIGTVILPEADVKIFLTASVEARARRRYKELLGKGMDTDMDAVLESIRYRDNQDSSRAFRPLKMAEDAVLLDTSDMTLAESEERMLEIIREKTGVTA